MAARHANYTQVKIRVTPTQKLTREKKSKLESAPVLIRSSPKQECASGETCASQPGCLQAHTPAATTRASPKQEQTSMDTRRTQTRTPTGGAAHTVTRDPRKSRSKRQVRRTRNVHVAFSNQNPYRRRDALHGNQNISRFDTGRVEQSNHTPRNTRYVKVRQVQHKVRQGATGAKQGTSRCDRCNTRYVKVRQVQHKVRQGATGATQERALTHSVPNQDCIQVPTRASATILKYTLQPQGCVWGGGVFAVIYISDRHLFESPLLWSEEFDRFQKK